MTPYAKQVLPDTCRGHGTKLFKCSHHTEQITLQNYIVAKYNKVDFLSANTHFTFV